MNGKVLVALAFDERMEQVVQTAEAYALMTGAKLRLIHVTDPWTKSFLAPVIEAGSLDLVDGLVKEAERVALSRLEQVQHSLAKRELAVEVAVISGEVTKAIAAEAAAHEASLIIIGAHRGGFAQTSLGFTTAVSLVMEAKVPVMIVNEETHLRPKAQGLGIFVADDFSTVGAQALDVAFSIAKSVRAPRVTHVHVDGLLDLPRAPAGRKLRSTPIPVNGGNRYQVPVPKAAAKFDLNELGARAEATLKDRAGTRIKDLEAAGGSYRAEVVFGAVAPELARAQAAARADIAFYGQHRVFHRTNAEAGLGHAGQMPFRAMLSESRPVVIVPQA